MANAEALQVELDEIKEKLADAEARAGFFRDENEKLAENLEKSEVQRKLLTETDILR